MEIPQSWYEMNNPYKYHIVLEFEDNGNKYIVFKYYGRYKQWWHYQIERRRYVESGFKCGLYMEHSPHIPTSDDN